MDIKVDLHLHTNFSDGAFSPRTLIDIIREKNISIASIVDHDSIDALPFAIEYANSLGIEIIPGVELSAEFQQKEIHILGYFFDIHNKVFNDYLQFFKEERLIRAEKIVHKLNNLGLKINLEDITNNQRNVNIGRPHIARVMVELNLVHNYYDAFNKYLKNGGPAYEKKTHLSPGSAIKIINDAGGLAFLAHPGNLDENILIKLIEAGLDGIEVIHPSHNRMLKKYYSKIADQFMLLKSGGSDFHGGTKFDEKYLGNFTIPYSYVEEIKKQLFKFNA